MQTFSPRSAAHPNLRWLLIVLATVILLVMGACGSNPTPTGPPSTAATQPPTSLTPSAVVMVKIIEMPAANYIFTPQTLHIKAGTEVVWINKSTGGHTVTSDTGAFKGSGGLAENQTFSMIFTQTGTFNYHCAYHIYMKGTVIVS